MAAHDTDGDRRLALENQQLRLRVAELERELRRVGEGPPEHALVAERAALWLEAERIAHVGTWVWNVVSDEVRWSEELFRILGYDPEVDVATTAGFFARVHPDDRERVARASEAGVASGVTERVDYRVLRADGTVRHVTMDAAFLFDESGELVRAVGTIQDLTEERAAAAELYARQQTLEEVARAAGVGWFRYDLRTGALTGSLGRILGPAHTGALDLDTIRERLLAPDRERAAAAWRALADGGEAAPLQVCGLDDEHRLVHVYVVPTVEADASGPAVVRGVALDVTQRVELETRLRQAEKMDLLGQVTAGVAHDFNNLLTVILCNLERLDRSGRHEAIGYIESAAHSASQLTRRLLAFSRQAVVEPQDVVVSEAIEECLAIVGRAFEDHIRIEHRPPAERLEVRVDPSQLQQILMNLTLNARDAMRASGGTLTVATRRVGVDARRAAEHEVEPGDFVEIEVRDTGVGMDDALMARIFEPFFTTKEPGQGTGLGLATVFGAVRQSGGFVEVRSRPTEGATFRVLLPARAAARAVAPGEKAGARPAPRRILLVEDEPMVATSLARMLRRHGHDVTACTTPASGIAAWRAAGGFELLITDFLMPEMTGLELTERLRSDDPDLPVLVLSGWGYESEPVAAMRRAQALPKPFTGEELLHAIARATASG